MSTTNIIFIFADQLRHDFLRCYGADFIETPNIDGIAARGVTYEKAYSPTPICVPARASLLTGCNSIKNGVMDNDHWLRDDLAACGINTWPELLSGGGYYTAAIGKMHFYPWDRGHGFAYRVIAEDKRWIKIRDDYYKHLRGHGERKYHGNEHEHYLENKGAIVSRLPHELSVDHFVGSEAVNFIDRYGNDGPFALMVGFPGPHCPYDPCVEYLERVRQDKMLKPIPNDDTSEKLRRMQIAGNKMPWNGVDLTEFTYEQQMRCRKHYAALVAQIDDEVGAILESVWRSGLEDKTAIIFTSDHGDLLGDHGLISKGNYYEGSSHVPLIVRLPNMTEAKRCDQLVSLNDVTATIAALAGIARPPYFDCTPLPELGLCRDNYDLLFGAMRNCWFVTDGRFKMTRFMDGDAHLFDLQNDPKERDNLYGNPAFEEKYKWLDSALAAYVMNSINLANSDKIVDVSTTLWNSDHYAKQNVPRIYPTPYHY